jgi:hypothetical protein
VSRQSLRNGRKLEKILIMKMMTEVEEGEDEDWSLILVEDQRKERG